MDERGKGEDRQETIQERKVPRQRKRFVILNGQGDKKESQGKFRGEKACITLKTKKRGPNY